VESFRARFSAAQGDLEAAGRWAQTAGLDVDGEISFLGEREYIILARVLIAQGALDKAGRLVARLLEMAQSGERWARVIELLVLQTLIYARIRQQDEAFAALSRALALAEPEGYVRTFVDAGPPMAQLLYQAAERGIAPDYAGRLIAAFPHPEHGAPLPASVSRSERPLHVVEPLSKREVEVLQLIAAGLSNKEIARELYLSTGTIKVHAHNIYGKLGVTGRTQAVARARSLSIIPND
jgi:LuxR family maltose regulon positive regulatory protein